MTVIPLHDVGPNRLWCVLQGWYCPSQYLGLQVREKWYASWLAHQRLQNGRDSNKSIEVGVFSSQFTSMNFLIRCSIILYNSSWLAGLVLKIDYMMRWCFSVWVMMNKQTRRLSKIPEEVRDEIEPHFLDSAPVVEEDDRKLPKLDEETADFIRKGLTVSRQLSLWRIPFVYEIIIYSSSQTMLLHP